MRQRRSSASPCGSCVRSIAVRALSSGWLALLSPFAAGAQTEDFQINAYTANVEQRPSVAGSSDGSFVVAWEGYRQESPGYNSFGVIARRFSSTGSPLTGDFVVNTATASAQLGASVGADAAGGFVVAWESANQDGGGYGVFARRFSSSGTGLATEFQVSSYTALAQLDPAVAVGADGDFIVAWFSDAQDGSGAGIFAQRFSSDGSAVASEFQVNDYTADTQAGPTVAIAPDGDFLVAWESNNQDDSEFGIFARRFASDGTPLATEFQVSSYTYGQQRYPSATVAGDGTYIVAWQDGELDGSKNGVFAQRISSSGAFVDGEFLVNSQTEGLQSFPTVASRADGSFVVAWMSFNGGGGGYDIFAQRFTSAGAPEGGEFQVNAYTTAYQTYPAAAAAGSGFVVAWTSNSQDGASYGVFAQRLAGPKILDIDGNGEVTALSDGLLVLRFLFGFTGTTLTGNAVGPGCTRCNAAAIEPYLQTLI